MLRSHSGDSAVPCGSASLALGFRVRFRVFALILAQAWGVLEYRAGNLERARELFQQGVWAQPKGRDVCLVWQVRSTPPPKPLHCRAVSAVHSGWAAGSVV